MEKLKSRFTIMKNFYIYRKKIQLILAYGVTIHKCQGLSLDCAIVDLSDKVFSPAMAYVAVSRVWMLQGFGTLQELDRCFCTTDFPWAIKFPGGDIS